MEPDTAQEAASAAEMPTVIPEEKATPLTGIPEESNTKERSRMRSSL